MRGIGRKEGWQAGSPPGPLRPQESGRRSWRWRDGKTGGMTLSPATQAPLWSPGCMCVRAAEVTATGLCCLGRGSHSPPQSGGVRGPGAESRGSFEEEGAAGARGALTVQTCARLHIALNSLSSCYFVFFLLYRGKPGLERLKYLFLSHIASCRDSRADLGFVKLPATSFLGRMRGPATASGSVPRRVPTAWGMWLPPGTVSPPLQVLGATAHDHHRTSQNTESRRETLLAGRPFCCVPAAFSLLWLLQPIRECGLLLSDATCNAFEVQEGPGCRRWLLGQGDCQAQPRPPFLVGWAGWLPTLICLSPAPPGLHAGSSGLV